MDRAQLANTAASGLVALCCLVFAVVYQVRAPWRSTSVGRHVMTFTLAIGALAAYTVVVTIWPDGLTAMILRYARTGLLLVIAGLVIQRTHMVLSAQHRGALLTHEPDRHQPPR
ncbi:hypothetical protein [Streptomyces sp. SID161]|uniref:putative phage holin n=1 Tax=Streptomyces sp. SID161 TaxID=2690251 RepID=UPI00136AA5E3|nr:hypothetical protein [Streptomyces sp. SID161]MYW43036.1 hypothetical protein [Streptomyces sp. SID161]